MISSSREKGLQAKQEDANNASKLSRAAASSSRQWSGFRNPRIVRVSRSFGGKDRHSKVCTVRGLRDRRIRLSVPTAIQLYDLQDRLGLSQPSKVIDWLIDNTKSDIDKLPPLQMPQGFGQFHQQMLFSQEPNTFQPSFAPFMEDQTNMAAPKNYWELDGASRGKSREEAEKGKWIEGNEQDENHHQDGDYSGSSAHRLFPISNHSSLPGNFSTNNSMPFNSYYQWDPSNLSLSQFGNQGFLFSQKENSFSVPSSLSLTSMPQLFLCPTSSTPLFPSYPPYVTNPMENDFRQMNNFQTMKPFSLNVNPSGISTHSPNTSNHPDEDDTDS
ncbi:hypothetical protein SLE2022_291800 [Rubroshorea leprosula]